MFIDDRFGAEKLITPLGDRRTFVVNKTDIIRSFAAAKTVRIIKPHADNKDVIWRIEHANQHGAFAVGMDIDHAFSHDGKYDVCRDLPMKPKSTEELKMFVQASKVPFIVKGVLSVQDAVKCAEAGVGGIVCPKR